MATKKLIHKVQAKREYVMASMAVFAVIGAAFLIASFAAVVGTIVFEAESGTVSGNARAVTTTDNGESGTGYVEFGFQAAPPPTNPPTPEIKPRIITLTDGEGDDRDSFVRFLMYTNDFDVMGIVATNSIHQRNGHGRGWIDDLINKYEQVRPNLILHDQEYPTAEYLRGKVAIGTEAEATLDQPIPHSDTPGSELILSEIRKSDPRPLYIGVWGGSNTAAQALYKLKNSFPGEFEAAASKVQIFTIHSQPSGQDKGYQWIGDNVPQAQLIINYSYMSTWDYTSDNNPYADELKSGAWLDENVRNNHGPLGASYGQGYVSEGDTPAFMHMVNNGLRPYVNPGYGGWGGRFELDHANVWVDAAENGSVYPTITRWYPAAQNDFEARMDWSVKPFDQANHPPIVAVNNSLTQTVAPGATVNLAAQVSDPDGNTVTSKWWQYPEAGTAGAVTIANDTSATGATFTVPNEPGKTIHMILEATDNGSPALKRYARIVFTIQ